jgi:hypothetical protein
MLGDSTLGESLTPSVNAPLKAYVAFLVLVAVCVCVCIWPLEKRCAKHSRFPTH